MKPYISLIIPTYRRVGLLQRHLRELCEQTLSPDLFEVIVVNNDQNDEMQWVTDVKRDSDYRL